MKSLYKEYNASNTYNLVFTFIPIKKIIQYNLNRHGADFFKNQLIKNEGCDYMNASLYNTSSYFIKVNNAFIRTIFIYVDHYEYSKEIKL